MQQHHGCFSYTWLTMLERRMEIKNYMFRNVFNLFNIYKSYMSTL